MVTAVSPVRSETPTAQRPSGAVSGAQRVRFLAALGRKLDAQDPAVAEQAATQLLSELFFVPLLAEMRQFPFGRELATGGQTESAFGQQLDQRVADLVAAGNNNGLREQIVRRLRPNSEGEL